MNNFDTVRHVLEAALLINPYGSAFNASVRDRAKQALTALAQIEAEHYSAADMADAQAKAFREGVASVQQGQEPVAHFVYFPDQQRGEFAHDLDDLCEDMTNDENHEVTPLFTAAPVAQQYEAGDVASAAAQGFRDGVASVAKQPQAEAVQWREAIKNLADQYASECVEFAEAIKSGAGSMSPMAAKAGDTRLALHNAIDCASPAPQQAEAVPPAHVLVPVEPSQAMIDAMQSSGWMLANYRAMLAAAQGEKP